MYRLLSRISSTNKRRNKKTPYGRGGTHRRSMRGERLDYSTNQLLILRNCPSDIMQILRLTGERLSSIPAQEVPLTIVSRCVYIHGSDCGPPPSFIRGLFFLTHPSYMPRLEVIDDLHTVKAGYHTDKCVARR